MTWSLLSLTSGPSTSSRSLCPFLSRHLSKSPTLQMFKLTSPPPCSSTATLLSSFMSSCSPSSLSSEAMRKLALVRNFLKAWNVLCLERLMSNCARGSDSKSVVVVHDVSARSRKTIFLALYSCPTQHLNVVRSASSLRSPRLLTSSWTRRDKSCSASCWCGDGNPRLAL